jgi:PAS domain S-box-containing protein
MFRWLAELSDINFCMKTMQEHFYKEIIFQSPFGFATHEIITADDGRPVDYRFIDVNQAFGLLTGLDTSTIIGKTVTEVIPGIENSEFNWIDFYGDVALNGKNETFEQYSELLESWYKVYAFSSQKGFFSTLFIDITNEKNDLFEREKTKKSLQQSEAKYRKLIENMNDIVYQTDDKMNITFVTKNIEKIGGYSADEVIGKKFTDFVHPTDLPDRPKQFEKIKKEVHEPSEYRYLTKNGSVIWVRTSANPIIQDGKFAGVQGILTDITDLKESENELRAANAKLESSNREKDKFFSIIAHDLRSPFSSVIGFSELLMDQIKQENYSGIEEYAGLIHQSSKKSMELLSNLMTWAHSKTGRMEFKPKKFKLFELAGDCLKIFEESASQKSIRLSLQINPAIEVYADKAMISTVFRNLIGNAVKFTYPDGIVHIAAKQQSNNVVVAVSDTGMGMSPEMVKNLFRLDKDTGRPGTNGETSTGLGLVICREFVEKHGGKIWAESKEESGSTFYFTLPLK